MESMPIQNSRRSDRSNGAAMPGTWEGAPPDRPRGGCAIRSLPALAAWIRQIDRCPLPVSSTQIFSMRAPAPAYRVQNHSRGNEARAAVNTVAQVADRLRRMAHAYGEWQVFDIPAFFDLWPEHAPHLVQVQERVSTVCVTFYADMLLPSFQRIEQYWAQEFFPAYQSVLRFSPDAPTYADLQDSTRTGSNADTSGSPYANHPDDSSSYTAHFLEFEQPKMCAYWEVMLGVVTEARRALWNDIGFLAAAAAAEEKAYWQWAWRNPPAAGLDERLLPALRQLPTLTLTVEFPLPPYRQPGRVRRLRRTWQSERRRRR